MSPLTASRAAARLSGSAVLVLSALFGVSCKEPPAPQRPAPVVGVTEAMRGHVPFVIVANGEVEPNRFVSVQSQVTGILTRVLFAEGDDVREGQVLFQIDERPFRAELERTQGVLARSEAQLARARTDSTRYEQLAADGYVTREQFDQILADVRALSATVSAERAAVERARFELSNATVRAPISGRTGQLAFREGNLVRSLTDRPLITINEVRPVLVRFAVPESDFAELRRRGGVEKQLPVGIRATSGDTSHVIDGVLAFVDNAIDRTSGAVTLKARVPNEDGALWPGQFVNVALEVAIDSNQVTVPAQAVVTAGNGMFVFTVEADGKAKRVPVTVGRQAGRVLIIEDGLSGGERIITDGQQRVADGAAVQVRTPGAVTGPDDAVVSAGAR